MSKPSDQSQTPPSSPSASIIVVHTYPDGSQIVEHSDGFVLIDPYVTYATRPQ